MQVFFNFQCDGSNEWDMWRFDVQEGNELMSYKIIWNANLMQQGNFVNVFLAWHVSGIYAHHQEQ